MVPDIHSMADPKDPTAELAAILSGIDTKLDTLEKANGGGGGRGKGWRDAAWRVLAGVLTALVLGISTLLWQLNNAVAAQTQTLQNLSEQMTLNRDEINRLRDWRDRHVESGR